MEFESGATPTNDIPELLNIFDRFDVARDDYINSFAIYHAKTSSKNHELMHTTGHLLVRAFRDAVEVIIKEEPEIRNRASQIASLFIGERKERIKFFKFMTQCEDPDDTFEELQSLPEDMYETMIEDEDTKDFLESITNYFSDCQQEDLNHYLSHVQTNTEKRISKKTTRILGGIGLRAAEIATGIGIYNLLSRR